MHVERLGTVKVNGIEKGSCYIFSKIDGTNACVWLDKYGNIAVGNRNRELSLEQDNGGFYKWITENGDHLEKFLKDYPNYIIYGEFLIKHTLNTYRDDAWNNLYVFDVWDGENGRYLHYNEYQPLLEEYGIEYIPPLCIIVNGNTEKFIKELDNNDYLIEDGKGVGEGLVIKNYNFVNRFGDTVWAKVLKSTFKDKFKPTVKLTTELVEDKIVDKFVTEHLVEKTYAKIINETEGWETKYISRLFDTVYYDLINEEIWEIIRKFKRPTIDFKKLYFTTTRKIKEIKPELF